MMYTFFAVVVIFIGFILGGALFVPGKSPYHEIGGIFLVTVTSAVGIWLLTLDFPPISSSVRSSGEIVKFYANGTGLLSNGTLVNLKGVFGCG